MKLCVDASVVVHLLRGTLSPKMAQRWTDWRNTDVSIVAPSLLRYEVTNVLYRYARAGELQSSDLGPVMRALLALPIRLVATDEIHLSALNLAVQFDLSATYDAHYLAVAKAEQAPLWTGDRRLFNRVAPHVEWIHLAE